MSFAEVVSVGSLDVHGVWGDEVRLPHGTGVMRWSRGFYAGRWELFDFFGIRGLCVFLRG